MYCSIWLARYSDKSLVAEAFRIHLTLSFFSRAARASIALEVNGSDEALGSAEEDEAACEAEEIGRDVPARIRDAAVVLSSFVAVERELVLFDKAFIA